MIDSRRDATAGSPLRDVLAVCGVLLVLDVLTTAVLYDRLPATIAVHWSATGEADNAADRLLAWFFPVFIGSVAALALVARRHIKANEHPLLAGAVGLACLYLFSASVLLLLANINNQRWQQGSVGGGWMLLVLLAPAAVFAAGVAWYRQVARR